MSNISDKINITLIKDEIIRYNFSVIKEAFLGDNIGEIKEFALESLPSSYLLCDGAEYARDQYKVLFSKIGTRYGAGDGSTTFKLPTKTMTDTLYGVKYK